jgi:hypothetical protein
MGKADPPAPPNPVAVSNAQTGSNVQTAVANSWLGNANTVGPSGTVSYSANGSHPVRVQNQDGTYTNYDVPSFTQTTTLSPAEQQKLDQQNKLGISLNNVAQQQTDKIGNILGSPLDLNSVGPNAVQSLTPPSAMTANTNNWGIKSNIDPTSYGIQNSYGPTDFSADRQRVEDALNSRVNPQIERDRNALETKLTNQGLVRGTTAFNNAMDEVNRQANDERNQVIVQGGAEQSRLAGLAQQAGLFNNNAQAQQYSQNANDATFRNASQQQLFDQNATQDSFNAAQRQAQFGNQATAGNFQNAARQAAIQEQLQQRNQPINEISALMSGGQVSLPQFQQYQGGTVAPTDVAGNYYNSAQLANQNYQTQAGQQNALVGGLAGLGGAGLYGLASGKFK